LFSPASRTVPCFSHRPGGALRVPVHRAVNLQRVVGHGIVVVAADDALVVHGELKDVVRCLLVALDQTEDAVT
jgi:hypothetical protein